MIKKKFLIFRRLTQILILILFISGNYYGFGILKGDYSSSLILNTIPLADPYALLQMFCAGAIIAGDALLGAIIITLFYSLFAGRAFCAWVCPVNLITDFANFLKPKLKIKNNFKINRNFRYYFLALSLIMSFLLGYAAFEMISPVSAFSRALIFLFPSGIFIFLIIFLFDLFVLKNGWCSHICPLGAFYSILGSKSILKVKYDHDKCTKCGKCKIVCPETHIIKLSKTEFINGKECIKCGACIDVCEDEALNFALKFLGEKDEKN